MTEKGELAFQALMREQPYNQLLQAVEHIEQVIAKNRSLPKRVISDLYDVRRNLSDTANALYLAREWIRRNQEPIS